MTIKIDESILYFTYSLISKINSKFSESEKYKPKNNINNLLNNKNYEKIIPDYLCNLSQKNRIIAYNQLKQYKDDLKKMSLLLNTHLDNHYKIDNYHIENSYNKRFKNKIDKFK